MALSGYTNCYSYVLLCRLWFLFTILSLICTSIVAMPFIPSNNIPSIEQLIIDPTPLPTPNPTPHPTPHPTARCCNCIDDRTTTGCKQDPLCEIEICDIHSFCCTSGWNTVCSNLADISCRGTSCCDCISPTPGIAGCAADLQCAQAICNLTDPFIGIDTCCSTEWNADCADLAQSFCNLNSLPSTTAFPTFSPTVIVPSITLTSAPTIEPTTDFPTTSSPSSSPTSSFTITPTWNPSYNPSTHPISNPSIFPTVSPTLAPSVYPTASPTICYRATYQGLMVNDAYLSPDDLFVSNNCLCRLQLTFYGNLILSRKVDENTPFVNIWMSDTNIINLSGKSTVKVELNSHGMFLNEYDSNVIVLWNKTTFHANAIHRLYLSDECVLKLNRKIIWSESSVTLSPAHAPTMIQTTAAPSYRTPAQCVDKCHAFSVTAEHYEYNDDVVCITYKVSRLFANGLCENSIKYLVLGLCEEDQAKCTVNDLNGLIESVSFIDSDDSDDSPNQHIWATNSQNQFIGIRVNMKVDEELSFNLSLTNVFLNPKAFSNAVRFCRGTEQFTCYDEAYLNGLPCLDWNKFIEGGYDDAVSVKRQMHNDALVFIAGLDPYIAYSLLSILMVFGVFVMICIVCICRNKKQEQEIVYVNNKNSVEFGHKHDVLATHEDEEEEGETELDLSRTNNEETTLSDEHSLIRFNA